MYVVLDGKVRISKHIPGAGEEALSFLERGAFFGEMALIERQARSATAVAHGGNAIVLGIPREVLRGLLDIKKVSSTRLLRLLCEMLARRLNELDDKLVGWHILSAGSRPPPGTCRRRSRLAQQLLVEAAGGQFGDAVRADASRPRVPRPRRRRHGDSPPIARPRSAGW